MNQDKFTYLPEVPKEEFEKLYEMLDCQSRHPELKDERNSPSAIEHAVGDNPITSQRTKSTKNRGWAGSIQKSTMNWCEWRRWFARTMNSQQFIWTETFNATPTRTHRMWAIQWLCRLENMWGGTCGLRENARQQNIIQFCSMVPSGSTGISKIWLERNIVWFFSIMQKF